MSSFWPEDLKLEDTQSPEEILEAAREDWQTSTNGLMDLLVQEGASESGNPIMVVHAKHVASNRTAALFSIIHRPSSPYPVAIHFKEEELPNFLRKSYQKPSSSRSSPTGTTTVGVSLTSEIRQMMGYSDSETISNPWVSDTPSEFRKNLASVLNHSVVKREILNLATVAKNSQ